MKKAIALLLVLVLVTMTTAGLADNGFLFLVSFLGGEDALGNPLGIYPLEGLEDDAVTTLYFDFPQGLVTLMGEDETSAPYAVTWSSDPMMMMVLLGAVSSNFSITESLCEHGLQIGWRLNEEDQVTGVVSDETAAAQLAAQIQEVFNAGASIEASGEAESAE